MRGGPPRGEPDETGSGTCREFVWVEPTMDGQGALGEASSRQSRPEGLSGRRPWGGFSHGDDTVSLALWKSRVEHGLAGTHSEAGNQSGGSVDKKCGGLSSVLRMWQPEGTLAVTQFTFPFYR